MYTDEQLAQMPIGEVVRLPGGNGLASPAFQIPKGFLGAFGWEHVEQGVETLVVDGEEVTQTQFKADLMRWLARRQFMRRVLLKPAPLEDAQTSALTRDQLELTLTVSLSYEVADPVAVAAIQAPITELTNLVIGQVAEYIRSATLGEIVSDDGALRQTLLDRLRSAPTIQGLYTIKEVLKALPKGDDRLIEVHRQTHIAQAETGLIDQRGRNEVIAAQHQHVIDSQNAQLEDTRAAWQHERDMEKRQAELQAQNWQTLVQTMGEIASAGMDPSKVLPQLLSHTVSGSEATPPSPTTPPKQIADRSSRVGHERTALESIREKMGIKSFDILESQGRLSGAMVHMPGYEIVLSCAEAYPDQAPGVTVRFPGGQAFQPSVPWIPGVSNLLAQVVVAVIPQVKIPDTTGEDKQPFTFDFDAEADT